MVDKITRLVQVPEGIGSTWKDMGDGTHALVVYIGNKEDKMTGALTTITYPHHEVHSGSTFYASYLSPHGSEIANDASLDILIQNSATKGSHLFWQVGAGGNAELLFYEDTTTTNLGTALAESNMNRASVKVAGTVVTHTPTVSAAGTLLANYFLPGGSGPKSGGGGVRQGTEWILEKSKVYLLRVTNRSGSAQMQSVVVEWYEESG